MKTLAAAIAASDRSSAWCSAPAVRCARITLGCAITALLSIPTPARATADRTGEQIYKQLCISCHGATGGGSEDYPRQLAGDRTVAQLARLIAKTMPEDDPGTCVGGDADKVAAYIYDAFYSKSAQARLKPPRIELSRLTVRQYRNAVADLIGSFRPAAKLDEKRGLRGQYFRSQRSGDRDRVIDRIDPVLMFDFGEAPPDAEMPDPNRFSIRWDGSIIAPETGDYEFIVKTEHSFRFWVNDLATPLIDVLVKSGDDTVYRGSIFLIGGRAYPTKLEFTKGRRGDPDGKKKEEKRPSIKASIALDWKRPHRPDEVVPERFLTPTRFPELFAVYTPFPPDDRNVGYERGSSISKAWDQAATDAALETMGYVAARLKELANTREDAADRESRLREFCDRFAERAFRRPLLNDEKALYIDRQFEQASNLDLAVKRVVLLVLKSPRFLYREIEAKNDGYDVASRLSFGLWDSLPDQALLDAAAGGRLSTRMQVAEQAERMANEPQTVAKLREFFLQWLRVEQVPDLSKSPQEFSDFNPEIASDLRTSLELFLDEILGSPSADFRQILLADYVYLNGRLAKFYGVGLPPSAPFQKVALNPGHRAGVLTYPYLMTTFAYTGASSPIHRGVFISRSVLGRSLRPPPEAVAPLAADLHPSLTTRERVTLQTKPAACITCHGSINPLGFGLEHFDAVGRYRDQEKGATIDATGSYEKPSGGVIGFDGAKALAAALASSEETHAAFIAQLFHHLVKQPIRAFGPSAAAELKKSFAQHDFSMRRLMVDIMAASAGKVRVADMSPKP
jgi:mono/diheme cytochrome c family protein